MLIEKKPGDSDFRLEAMRLAQYFYTAQDICNKKLKQAISSAYLQKRLSESQKKLEKSRVEARLLLIAYHDHQKYLTREKRKALTEILETWEFDALVQNSTRMVAVCTSKLQETQDQKREKSSWLTDLLLVSLSFVAIFELSMSLTEYSREVMSRPALEYRDDKASTFLSFIASIDADVMFTTGIVLTLVLFVMYILIKKR